HISLCSYRMTSLSYSCFTASAPHALHTLSLHDALPICRAWPRSAGPRPGARRGKSEPRLPGHRRSSCASGHVLEQSEIFSGIHRSEEHTSELQSRENLVCRLLLEKKKKGGKTRQNNNG